MEENSGRVEDPPGSGSCQRQQCIEGDRGRVGLAAGLDHSPRFVDSLTGDGNDQRLGQRVGESPGDVAGESVNAGKVSQLHVAQITRMGILSRMRPLPALFALFLVTPIVEIAFGALIERDLGQVLLYSGAAMALFSGVLAFTPGIRAMGRLADVGMDQDENDVRG